MRWWGWRCKWRTKERWWLRLIVCCLLRVSLIYGWRSPESSSPITTLYSCPFNSMCHCLTLPNETTVLQINCNEVSLYKFPDFSQTNIRHIEISRTALQSVDEETFQGLRLESLKLNDNDLHDFSDRSFNSMTHSLMSLDVSGNSLKSLCLNALRNLHTLNRLYAQRNQIEYLDGNWGSLTESLRSLHLSNNFITDFYHSFDDNRTQQLSLSSTTTLRPFSKLRKLVMLDLSGNRISQLATNSLPRSLVTVDLSRNLLPSVPIQALQHLRDLRVLSLKDNFLTNSATMDEKNPLGLGITELMNTHLHLEKLDLSLNALEAIPDQWFNVDSTMFRVKAINFDRNFIRRLPAGVFEHSGLAQIILAFNRIEIIEDDAFDGLEHSLEYLDLERNLLQNVSAAFEKLQRIRYIYLTANQLEFIEVNLPGTLRVLSLAGNNFSQLPINSLENCTELSYLNLGYNKIADLPENSFVGWGAEIQTLLLRNNKISSLNYGAFNGLEAIKEISLSFNDIHYLHPSTFHNISKTLKILELSFGIYRDDIPYEALNTLTELMWLGLDNNNFKFIPDDSLLALHELSYINLAFNRISILPRTIFMPQIHRNLMEIDLSFNQVERLYTNTFDELVLLQFVNLQGNRIRSLERHSFHNLPYLSYLDLSHNELQNVSEAALAFLPNLLNIDLTHNRLSTLSFKMFRHVSNYSTPLHLNCSHNSVTQIDGDVGSHLFVNTLDLSYNLLTDTSGLGNLRESLRFLYLHHNNISLLHNNALGDLPRLLHLDLSCNNLTQLRRRSFSGLPNLQELNLSHNKLDALQFEQFANLKKLRVLNLSHNRLRNIPRDSFINTRLEVINLSDNQLSLWPVSAISDVGFTLRAINVDGNYLEYLDATMFGNVNFLLKLSLARNRITVLPDNTFVHLMNLTELNLSHNPLIVTNFRELFSYLPRLRRLWMRDTELKQLPSMIGVAELILLDIGQNSLTDISALRDLPKLRDLKLDANKLTNLTQLGRNLPLRLNFLGVSGNPLQKVSPQDFGQLRYLSELLIQDVTLPVDVFSRLLNLRRLSVTAQPGLGEALSRVRSLRQLHINVIAEESIPPHFLDAIANNTKVSLLEVTGQALKAIAASAFDGLRRSQELTIRIVDTQINDLPPGLFYALRHVPRLTIDISNNLIATLAPDTFYANSSAWDAVGTRSIIGGLDVYGNPLQCDCGLVWVGHWLRRWLRESAQISPISKEEMRKMLERARRNSCIDPTTGKKLNFLEVFPEDLLCHASALSSKAVHHSFTCFPALYIVIAAVAVATTTTLVSDLFSYFYTTSIQL